MVPARVDSHSPLHSAAAWCGLGFCQHHNWWSVKGPLCPGRPWWRRPVMCVLCEDPGFPGGRVCSLLPTGQPAHTPLTAHGLSAGTQVQAGPSTQGPGAQGATTQPWVHAPCQLSQASGPPPLAAFFSSFFFLSTLETSFVRFSQGSLAFSPQGNKSQC